MAVECKKSSICEAGALIVSTHSKGPLQNDNNQAFIGGTMSHEGSCGSTKKRAQAEVDVREVYFLIMHFLSDGPCLKTCAQLRNELSEYRLLPRRYHAWYSRSGACSGDDEDDGISVPLSYSQLLERYSFIEKSHLVKLLEQLYNRTSAWRANVDAKNPTAADASTLLGSGSVSLLNSEQCGRKQYMCCWNQGDQIHGLTLREIGGGLARHHRAPSIRAASYAIVKPSVLVNRIQIIKTFRGHRNAVYCAIFDKSGEYIITGSDDRLVKIWSTTTGFCLRSCRGHEGDITDLAVSANNTLVASASNDCYIRVWRFPDGFPISVLKGHTCAVTAIAFSPRQGCEHHLLSTSDDGTCRIWDARDSSVNARIYAPKSEGLENGSKVSAAGPQITHPGFQILCCAFNASGTIFVTGSADKLARVWDACKWTDELHGGPNHELDSLKGHEDDVNYVQFSGCAAPSRPVNMDGPAKDDRNSKFRNSWFAHESIVTCSRDGSAIIWVPRPRKYHGKSGRWAKAYHLRVPPPPMPPQPPRGVPRQRLLPTPRGVNMIVWSLDNCYVLAAIMDCRICVWNAVDGSLVHSLTGHTKSTFVLDVHPYDPRVAMSAGYDGRVIIWDIWEGRSIHVYETGEFNLVDGKFSPDGTSIVISDEVGQIYHLATGEGQSQKDAKYDQFFLGDYRPLTRDVHGHVLDQETQLPPQQRNVQDLLCDANMLPYAEPYQSMFQQRRLGALGINWQPPSVQWAVGTMDDGTYFANELPGIFFAADDDDNLLPAHQGRARWVEQPIDEDAMDWEQDTVDDTGSDYTLSYENASDEDEREGSLSCTDDSLEEEYSSEDEEESPRAHLRRSERNKRKEEGAVITSSGRLVKRKYKDGSEEYSIRRSKRRKKAKTLRKGSSSRRVLDQEQSRRPKRLAARNARLIFSQISAEEEEQMSPWQESHSDSSEEQSSAHSVKELENVEKVKESSTVEGQPSEVVDSDHPGRLVKMRFPSKKLVNNGEQGSPNSLDQATEQNVLSLKLDTEALACTSTRKYNDPGQLNSQNEFSDNAGLDRSTEVSSKAESVEGAHENINPEDKPLQVESGFTFDRKRTWESRGSKSVKRARVGGPMEESLMLNNDEPSSNKSGEDETLDGKKDTVLAQNKVSTERASSPGCSLQETDKMNGQQVIESFAETSEIFQSGMIDNMAKAILKNLGQRDAEQEFDSSQEQQEKSPPEQSSDDVLESNGVGKRKPVNQSSEVDDFACNLDFAMEKSQSHGCNDSEEEAPHELDAMNQSSQLSNSMDPCMQDKTEPGARLEVRDQSSSLEHDVGTLNDNNAIQRPEGDEVEAGEYATIKFMEQTDDAQEEGLLEKNGQNYDVGLYTDGKFYEGETDALECSEMSAREREESSEQEETTLKEHGHSVGDASIVKERTFCVRKEGDMVAGEALKKVVIQPSDTCIDMPCKTEKTLSGLPARRHQLMGTSWQHNSPMCLWLRQGISEATAGEISMSDEEASSTGREEINRIDYSNSSYEAEATLPFKRGKRGVSNHIKRENSHTKLPTLIWKKKENSEPPVPNLRCDVDTKESRMPVRARRTWHVERCGNTETHSRSNERSNDCRTEQKETRFFMRPRSSLGWKEASLHGDEFRTSEDFAAWKGKKPRKKKVSWLLLTKVEEGTRYIPQLGDEVAYVIQGHDEFPGSAKLEDKGPSKVLRTRLHAVEICLVVGLDYGSIPGFNGVSCKLTLKLVGEDCRAVGKTFRLSLPELTDFPDFIIERSRYEASIRRNWTKRDKCRVWWREDTLDEKGDEKGGKWYDGRVVSVDAKSSQFPDSPWDRCSVQYKGDSTGPHRHSPWELFDFDSTEIVSSQLDDANKLQVLASIKKVEESCTSNQDDEYGLHGLRKLIHKPDFLSKTPVPLSLETIKDRLNNNYYRSLEALRHDIQLIVCNAQHYLYDSELPVKLQKLANHLLGDE